MRVEISGVLVDMGVVFYVVDCRCVFMDFQWNEHSFDAHHIYVFLV